MHETTEITLTDGNKTAIVREGARWQCRVTVPGAGENETDLVVFVPVDVIAAAESENGANGAAIVAAVAAALATLA